MKLPCIPSRNKCWRTGSNIANAVDIDSHLHYSAVDFNFHLKRRDIATSPITPREFCYRCSYSQTFDNPIGCLSIVYPFNPSIFLLSVPARCHW